MGWTVACWLKPRDAAHIYPRAGVPYLKYENLFACGSGGCAAHLDAPATVAGSVAGSQPSTSGARLTSRPCARSQADTASSSWDWVIRDLCSTPARRANS